MLQAFAIYREAVANAGKPSMCTLNRVLMCMRVAWEGKVGGRGCVGGWLGRGGEAAAGCLLMRMRMAWEG